MERRGIVVAAAFLRAGNANLQRESYFQWRNAARRFPFFLRQEAQKPVSLDRSYIVFC